jgi:tRNA A-37 threonylcarbamoyl transferase component Bud32
MSKKELEELTVKELKEYCKKLSVDLKTTDKKTDIIDKLSKKIKKVRFDIENKKVYKIKDYKKTPSYKTEFEKQLAKDKKEEKKEKKEKKEKEEYESDKKKKETQLVKDNKEKDKKERFNNNDKNLKQIGHEGKDAFVYEITDFNGNKHAMKKYKKEVKSVNIKKEIGFLEKLRDSNITPKVIYSNVKEKYIIMEMFDKTLFDEINEKGKISQKTQKDILKIHDKLDNLGVFHGDPSPLNLMFKENELKVIDFGFSRDITPELKNELNSERPNYEITTLGLVLKIKDKVGKENISILINSLPKKYLSLINE